ncbi:MAG: hypothetical protein KME47_10100 [Nodosilinea sp. WJT8-NPBG4]|jgi:hypothetical protein|nr:hypothetical protein [Nodosilinea sp. WJT8-NPBG4]
MRTRSYKEFIESKAYTPIYSGIDVDPNSLNKHLFDFQRHIVTRALCQGRFCIWAGVGLGKSLQQLTWAHEVHKATNKPVIILAPLAVSHQTIREGIKFGIDVTLVEQPKDVVNGINITNYEKVERFDLSDFVGIVLDESSILKNQTGKYRNALIDACKHMPFRLACSATPAPNDYMELGNHAEFIGIRSYVEMLAEFFTHDGGDTAKWRLKKHGASKFWEWVAAWAVMLRKPQDLGFSADGYDLPKLNLTYKTTDIVVPAPDGQLFWMPSGNIQDRRYIRKCSIDERCKLAAELVNNSDEQWLVWCGLNDESALLKSLINDAVEVKGSDKEKHKTESMLGFQDGHIKALVSKPSICGMGLNFQQSHNMIFVGLSDSFEELYQAIGRQHRFGQVHSVNAYVIHDVKEGMVINNIKRKWVEADSMLEQMVIQMQKESIRLMGATQKESDFYESVKFDISDLVTV